MKLDNNFISSFKKNLPSTDENTRYRVYVFLVCLAISTFMWFLIALSQESITTLDYPVNFIHLPEDMTLVNRPDSILSFRISSGGFELMTLKYLTRKNPIEIDLSQIALKPNKNLFNGSFSTADISARFFKDHNFAEGVVSYSPQFFQFLFEPLKWRKVPVHFNGQITFAPQYRLASQARLVPDSVKITGAHQTLDKVSQVETLDEPIKNINASTDFSVELINPDPEGKLQMSPEKIHIFIDTERFTETSIEVPVSIRQKDVEVKLFPSVVKLTYLVSLEDFKRVNAEAFKVVIDLNENPEETKAKVYLEKKPVFVDVTKIEPEFLEYLVIKKQ